jgi:hypothetical protein
MALFNTTVSDLILFIIVDSFSVVATQVNGETLLYFGTYLREALHIGIE